MVKPRFIGAPPCRPTYKETCPRCAWACHPGIVAFLGIFLFLAPLQLQAESVPRKTGNMTITSYRTPLMKGQKPGNPLDPMLRDPARLKQFGFSSIEDYPTLDVIEPEKGKFNFAPHIANAKACRQHGLKYAIYPWVHFYPDWVEKEPGFTPYTNLEDGTTCRQPSGWAPFTTKLMDHFYRVMAEHIGEYVDAVYVTDCAEYGELGYPNGYTKWLRPDDNAKVAWWCGDQYARADFRKRMLQQYKSLDQLNAAWETVFKDKGDITYPPLELLKSNPDPRKLTPQQRRWILDFVYWYQDSSARRVKEYVRIAQEYFPVKPIEIKLGHADERAIMGHSYSSACSILRGTRRLKIRSTHASVSYFHIKRVTSAARRFKFPYLTEPPGTVKPEKMAERIFMDACAGVTQYFDYPGNPPAAGEAFANNIDLLQGRRFSTYVALFFPEADHYLRIDKPYPEELLACVNAIRDVTDYNVLDERLIRRYLLQQHAVLVIVGDPIIETSTFKEIARWLSESWLRHRGTLYERRIIQIVGSPVARPVGTLMCVDGQTRSLLEEDSIPETWFRHVIGPPDGDETILAVQDAARMTFKPSVFRKLEDGSGKISDEMATLLTKRDDIWTGITFDLDYRPRRPDISCYRILAYNAGTEDREVQNQHLKPGEIREFIWGPCPTEPGPP